MAPAAPFRTVPIGAAPELLAFASALFVIAALEAAPSWGKSVPGHLGLATVAAIAVALGTVSPWLAVAAAAGAVLSDVAAFAWVRLRPFHGVWRGGSWWRAGLDVDDLSEHLRTRPLRAFVRAKFSTKERARLPFAAAKSGMAGAGFAALSVAGSFVWAPVWVGIGAAIGGITLLLPSEGDFVVLSVGLVTLSTLVTRPPQPI